MNKIIKAIKHPKVAMLYLLSKKMFYKLSDERFLKIKYRLKTGKKLNIKEPKRFNEKMQWLKLYDRKDLYSLMVDKCEVKDLVGKSIGFEYVVPTIAVYNSFDDINFDELPNKFVLKCTHDSGTVIVCKDKATLDIEAARNKINNRMTYNYYYNCREWPYKNVKPRIIAEELIEESTASVLNVYKVFNFNNGEQIIQVIQNDKTRNESVDYFDKNWNLLDICQNYPNSETPLPKPKCIEKMLELSNKLSDGFPFMRTDFYEADGKLYFSEFTFYSDAGFATFKPDSWDYVLGQRIILRDSI